VISPARAAVICVLLIGFSNRVAAGGRKGFHNGLP
jgi:hypothetical protein